MDAHAIIIMIEKWFNPKIIPAYKTELKYNSKNKNNSIDDDRRKIIQQNSAKEEGEFSYLVWRIENDWHFKYHVSTFSFEEKNAIYSIIELLKKENLSQSEKYNILNLVLNSPYSCKKQISYLISNITNSTLLFTGINLLLETKSVFNYKYITLLLSYANKGPNKSLTDEETLNYCKCIANYPNNFQKQFIIDLLNYYPKLRNYVPYFDTYSIGKNVSPLTLSYFCRYFDKDFLELTDPLLIQYVASILYQYINTKPYLIKENKNTIYLANIRNLIINPNYEVIYLILNNSLFNAYGIASILSKSDGYDKNLEMITEYSSYGMRRIRQEIATIFSALKEKDDINVFISLVEDFFSAIGGDKECLNVNSNFLAKMKELQSIKLQLKKE